MGLLTGAIQHYDWGDERFLPDLQGRAPTGRPEAEWWLGTHPRGPSTLEASGRPLAEVIADDPAASLGAPAAERFGELPFLAKILAAARPLSIQTHPSAEQARRGFDREEAAGIPRDDPARVYADPGHKPELICALTRFDALCGFRPVAETIELLAGLGGPVAAEISERLAPGDRPEAEVTTAALAGFLRDDPATVARLVAGLVEAGRRALDSDHDDRAAGARSAGAVRWLVTLGQDHPRDPGVLAALLLDHVVLEPGQALFLGPGNVHAYLHGAGVEVMASSDNVIRGGLTTKHVDVDELVEVVAGAPRDTPVQTPAGSRHTYDVPVADMSLTRVELDGRSPEPLAPGPRIVIVTDGKVVVDRAADGPLTVPKGRAAWVPANCDAALTGTGVAHVVGAGASAGGPAAT